MNEGNNENIKMYFRDRVRHDVEFLIGWQELFGHKGLKSSFLKIMLTLERFSHNLNQRYESI